MGGVRTIKTKIDRHGRVVLPAAFRDALGIKEGDHLVMRLEEGEVRITTFDEAIRQAQAIVAKYIEPGRMLSDELIAERRAEAERE